MDEMEEERAIQGSIPKVLSFWPIPRSVVPTVPAMAFEMPVKARNESPVIEN